MPKLYEVDDLVREVEAWVLEAGVSGELGSRQFPHSERIAAPSRTRRVGRSVRYFQVAKSRLPGNMHVYWGSFAFEPPATDPREIAKHHDSQSYGSPEFVKSFFLAWLVELRSITELPTPVVFEPPA